MNEQMKEINIFFLKSLLFLFLPASSVLSRIQAWILKFAMVSPLPAPRATNVCLAEALAYKLVPPSS